MKVLGIIPARSGSKRVPGKNLKSLGGKPLILHIMDQAIHSEIIDTLVVSTDDKKILELTGLYKNVIPIERPSQLSEDTSLAIEYVKHALTFLENTEGKIFDIVVILQPTSPFTLTEDIDQTIQLLIDSKADSSVSVVKLDHMIHPFKLKVLIGDQLHPFLEEEKGRMAEHELPAIYVRNCAVYASKIHVIDQNKIIGDDCRAYIMPRERSLDINDPFDFDLAEFLFKKFKSNE